MHKKLQVDGKKTWVGRTNTELTFKVRHLISVRATYLLFSNGYTSLKLLMRKEIATQNLKVKFNWITEECMEGGCCTVNFIFFFNQSGVAKVRWL